MLWLILAVNITAFDKRPDSDVWGKGCHDSVILQAQIPIIHIVRVL